MVERLSGYRRHLRRWLSEGHLRIYSHELAALIGATSAQVRRDLMTVGFSGSPARGYDVEGLIEKLGSILDPYGKEAMALVGVGSLGRAILNHFSKVHPERPIVALFDVAADKVDRLIDGCRCHASRDIEEVLADQNVLIGIIAVPPEAAQEVADRLVHAGVRGLMNFTPVRLHVPPEVFVEDVDISVSLERVSFFARSKLDEQETRA
jgi:redox-sensing transcriptional repressor